MPIRTERARDLRRHSTDAERTLWALLRAHRLADYKFRRQVPIGPYIVDFLCHQPRLIIELDGGQHLDSTVYDTRRTAALTARGYHLLRLWNTDLLQDPQAAADHIHHTLTTLDPTGKHKRNPAGG